MHCTIKKVENNKDLLNFIKSQWSFYKNNPNFVPPLISERKAILDKEKNPLYEHADYQLFIAENAQGNIVGRIGAIENRRHNMIHKDKVGFWGFFECVDDQEVANSLFDAAADWLKQKGLNVMRGPVNPTFNDDLGMLLNAYDQPPVVLMTYNPEYYPALCDNYGFKKAKDLYAYLLNHDTFCSEKLLRLASLIKERHKIDIRCIDFKDKKQLQKDIDVIREIYNAAWQPNWGFVKMTDKEFNHMAHDLVSYGISETTLMAEIEGKPVGFALALPDMNQVLIHNKNGGMLGAGIQLLARKKKIDLVRIIVLGILPEYQKLGVDALLYYTIGENAYKVGISKGEASWILEDNLMMNRALTQTMHAYHYKTYRIYDKNID